MLLQSKKQLDVQPDQHQRDQRILYKYNVISYYRHPNTAPLLTTPPPPPLILLHPFSSPKYTFLRL